MFGDDTTKLFSFFLLGAGAYYFMYQNDMRSDNSKNGTEERYDEEEEESFGSIESGEREYEEDIPVEYEEVEQADQTKTNYCETELTDTGNDPYLKSILYQDGLDKDPYYNYDRQYDRLTADELLPLPRKNAWTDVNPSILHRSNKDYFKAEENFLITNGRFIGVLSGSQSNKNANLQLRPEPPVCVKSPGPWYNTTVGDKRQFDMEQRLVSESIF